VIAFFDSLCSLRLSQGGEDHIWWIPSKRRKFEVRSLYHELFHLFIGRVCGESMFH
jgi:hypothetical protein